MERPPPVDPRVVHIEGPLQLSGCRAAGRVDDGDPQDARGLSNEHTRQHRQASMSKAHVLPEPDLELRLALPRSRSARRSPCEAVLVQLQRRGCFGPVRRSSP